MHNPLNKIDAHLAARFKLCRKELGLTQQQMAQHLGISYQMVQKFEWGKSRLSASQLAHWAPLLQRPLVWFFDGL